MIKKALLQKTMEMLIRAGEARDAPRRIEEGRRFVSLGDVLKGAVVEVHSVEPAKVPEEGYSEVEDPEPQIGREGPLTWFRVDLTLRPAPEAGEATYDPVGFVPAGPDSRSGTAGMAADANRDFGEVREIEVWNGHAWEDAGMGELSGAQRLRLLLGVPDGLDTLRFRYHYEVFGEIRLR
jgi:hypothetical protein